MALHVDEKWLQDYCRRTGQEHLLRKQPTPKGAPKRSKYGNRRTKVDGKDFDSRHEAEIYLLLKSEVQAGKYRALLEQVEFLLPGGVKYRADFVTLNADGTYTVFDAKSEATRKDKVYRLKRRQMRECLGIVIREV